MDWKRVSPAPLLAAALAGIVSCSDSAAPKFGPPTQLVIVTAPPTTATNRSAFATQPVIQVQDAQSRSIDTIGIAVTVALTAGGGLLTNPVTVETDNKGKANFTGLAIFGKVGQKTLTFSAAGLTSASTNVTLEVGPAIMFVSAAGDSQTAAVSTPVTIKPSVKLMDADSNVISGAAVTFSVFTGGGSVTGGSQTTDAAGVATVGSWTLGPSLGANSLRAVVPAVLTAVFFDATAVAGAASQVDISAGDGQSATIGTAVSVLPSVIVKDAGGHVVSGAAVTFAVASGGGSVTGASTTTNANGIASVGSWTLGLTAGSNTLTATSAGLTGSPRTFTATGTVGPASAMIVTVQPLGAASGAAFTTQPGVRLVDAGGNIVTQSGVVVTAAKASGSGTIGGTLTATTNASGIATFTNLQITGTGPHTIQFSAPSVASATSASVMAVQVRQLQGLLVAGGAQTCGLNAGNAAWCWGLDGALSISATSPQLTPAALPGGQTFTMLAAGGTHTCGLTAGGSAYCWGRGSFGQLGNNTNISFSDTPVLVSTGEALTKISAGVQYTCGLTAAGTAYCWGTNESGELGDQTTTDRSAPVAVAGGFTFSAITAGYRHACGLTATGAAYCWGYNFASQLGDQTITSRSSPVAVNGGRAFSSIAAGYVHTCGLEPTGIVYCWGSNEKGQLGRGVIGGANTTTPTAVSGGVLFATITSAFNTVCGLTAAGAAYCWGDNFSGQLGDGTIINRATPTLVSGGLGFAALTVGDYHTCGVTAAGAAHCWGNNVFGELGNGEMLYAVTTPKLVLGGLTFGSVSVGNAVICGITTGNATYCWGNNNVSVGDGSSGPRYTPTAISGGRTFTKVSVGGAHACALTAGGNAYCWGLNFGGQLGDATTTQRSTPTIVAGAATFTAITAGGNHTCVTVGIGTAFCWGSNSNGQIGDSTNTQRNSAQAVAFGSVNNAVISAGYNHTCSIGANDITYCWGANSDGQLGDNSQADRLAPVVVSGGLTFTSLSEGSNHTCALTGAGAAYCWGANSQGQIGDGTNTRRLVPTPVSGGLTFTTIGSGFGFSCGLVTGGAAYCWGFNNPGYLGDLTQVNRNAPVPVSGGRVFSKLAVGAGNACGVQPDGALYCWGTNSFSLLGIRLPEADAVPKAVVGGIVFRAP